MIWKFKYSLSYGSLLQGSIKEIETHVFNHIDVY
jgi:hypothetical protein